MYRAVTWAALDRGVAIEDEAAVVALAEALHIDIRRPTMADGRQYTVLADGTDVTWEIRTPAVDRGVSPVSAYAGVRAALTAQQRRIGARGGVVMVGRDIGTVVLPDADLKIYLDATLEERAARRHREIVARSKATGEPGGGETSRAADYRTVRDSVRRRDEIDSGRALAPLRPAADAVVVDTTALDVDQVLEEALRLAEDVGECLEPASG
jgi:cytidylate kinase